jgi:endonuclease/exonuclease/phosphatase family metal-dependent hydrolase
MTSAAPSIRRRGWLLRLGALAATGCAARLGRGPAITRDEASLRLMTLNLAHGRGRSILQGTTRPAAWYRHNLETIAELFVREQPDLIALQEAEVGSRWAGDFDHVDYLAQRCGAPAIVVTPHVVVPGHRRYGTALLVRGNILAHGGNSFDAQGRWAKGYTWARLQIRGAELTVVSLHLEFSSAARRRAQADELALRFADVRGPLAVLGDFNATWSEPRSPVVRLAEQLALHPADPTSAAPSTHPASGRHLDWILGSPHLSFTTYRVLTLDRVSDHRAVLADALVPRDA